MAVATMTTAVIVHAEHAGADDDDRGGRERPEHPRLEAAVADRLVEQVVGERGGVPSNRRHRVGDGQHPSEHVAGVAAGANRDRPRTAAERQVDLSLAHPRVIPAAEPRVLDDADDRVRRAAVERHELASDGRAIRKRRLRHPFAQDGDGGAG
jgi:hypothetical protein